MHYQGPPITVDEERGRQGAQVNSSRSSATSQQVTRKCTILSFWGREDGNLVDILTEDGLEFTQVRLRTPLQFVLMHWGEPEKLTNIPGTVTFHITPDDGFVDLGSTTPVREDEHSRHHYQPFYL